MDNIQIIRCPNCGDRAIRHIVENSLRRTSCFKCDYLLVQCSKTERVIEAYAPGTIGYPTLVSAPR
ncbi:MAG: hypothetical protein AAFQ80_13180 [Cyanobacteria bacterium J06621_8]